MNYSHIRDRLDPIYTIIETLRVTNKINQEGADILYQAILMACDEAYIAGEINARNG